ncbi:MAG TPA: alcohol dehydrogenase catalytic domain-containing protein [Kribbellaceae bacterium]|nr:alcohol dehydrogenase catalytic domain-containing protein [Kribbellaceae bacterium]
MRAAVLRAAGDVVVADVADPFIREPTDALVRVRVAAVCGSDLWAYRGQEQIRPFDRLGHEWIGTVEEVGPQVSRLRRGDLVVAPFAFADGTCRMCSVGLYTSCPRGGIWGGASDGGQAEALRVPFADATLVPVRADTDPDLDRRLLALTDVMGTGCHAVALSGAAPGGSLVVIGDGAVGLCTVLAARRARVERVLAVGHHGDRMRLAERFGATHTMRGDAPQAVAEILDYTGGGATSVAECVGSQSALDLALAVARPGGTVGSVGVPNGVFDTHPYRFFRDNITLRSGIAPVRRYLHALVADVLTGTVDPSPVFTVEVTLADVAEAYRAMDERRAVKALVRP